MLRGWRCGRAMAGLTAQASSSRPKSGNEDDPQNVMLQVLLAEMQVDPDVHSNFKLVLFKGETAWERFAFLEKTKTWMTMSHWLLLSGFVAR